MNWNVKKIEEKNTPKFLSFEVIKRVIDNKEDKETKKENEFSYQARMFIKDFEGFSKTKDKPKNHQEEPQEKQKRENTAYAYYDSEGIPTIGYGFNLTDFSVFEILKDYLHPKPNNWGKELGQIQALKFEKKEIKVGEKKKNIYVLNKISNNEKWEKITQEFHKNHQKKDNQESLCFDKAELGKNIETFDSILQSLFPYTLSRDLSEKSIATLLYKKIKTITNANEATREGIVKTFLGSSEGVALLSLYYNNPTIIGRGLREAYEENNRFKMWFEIRYNSNKGKDIGIAKRRFAESNVFGLFKNTKRGEGYKNTAKWGFADKENTNTAGLKETIRFFISLHSKFEKEGKKSYFEYVKYYESEKSFGGTTIPKKLADEDERNKPNLKHHFRPHTEVFSPFVKTFNEAMKEAIGQTNQEANNSNNQQQELKFTLENILVITKDNCTSIIETINEKSAKGELAIILEKGYDLGFLKYQNQKIEKNNPLHIILSFDNHIDCSGFINSNNMTFYILKDDKIIKLCGSKNPLKSQEISFQDTTLKGLMQINKDEGIIYCFKEQANGKFSPNLSIYCKDTFELIATIYNLRSEGENNA
ncbi:hypothetical protein CQA57_07960 [Helicobacter anseris]|uniref:Uncharacterized protein n=1 Tax=Helicobacter anseris TaxID=375926 RepID=A0A3D8J2V2_9HELI|nr:hypothetical protein [Helicobacter anseris]RDU71091.1 hypothetical protein CQA57_07960 [Helicobacter anseris]